MTSRCAASNPPPDDTMKIRKTAKQTPKPWELDLGIVGGTRQRKFFESEDDAKSAMKEKLDVLKLHGEHGLLNGKCRTCEAMQETIEATGWTVAGMINYAKTHPAAKAVLLSEAIERCLESKRKTGKRETYLGGFGRTLTSLLKFCGDIKTSAVTHEQIDKWSRAVLTDRRKIKKQSVNLWTVRGRLIDATTLFNFCVKHKLVSENPCAKIERVQIEDKPPAVASVEQVETLLDMALKRDPAIIGYLAPILFGGLRPHESMMLAPEDIHDGLIEVQGRKAKTRQRRFIPINETLAAWLKVEGVEFGLPARTSRLLTLRKRSKFQWAHDILRHCFFSYGLPKYGARDLAAWGGNSETIIFAHYRERVKPAEAERYWGLRP